ncbi:MAG TPA: TonB-dependent receptor [Steroidobacteraceae bacterium]|nr:TonB-dependent receptor [Steroidobacteraceae bacterium]
MSRAIRLHYFVAGLLAAAENVTAQPAPAVEASPPPELVEITVTAQKREQALNDVGLSVSVTTGEELAAVGITEVTDLPKVTSGFTVGKTYTGYPVFSIRGINFNASQFSAAPAVTTYLDEAPLPYGPMSSGVLYDIQRVEVLKGPQGTLFGQNATGGSINLIAAKPTSDFAAGISGELNDFGAAELTGFASGPVSDTLRVRFAATTSQGGAWQRGYYLKPEQRNGDQEKGAARVLLEWQPTDALTINLNLNGFYDHSQPQLPQLASVNIAVPGNGYPGLQDYPLPTDARAAESDVSARYNNRNTQEALRIDWDMAPHARLTSITNYVDSKFFQPMEASGTADPLIHLVSLGTGRSFSEEFRLSGALLADRLNYTIGGNLQRDHMLDAHQNEDILHFSTLPPNTRLNSIYTETNRANAAFANADFSLARWISVTGGVRYTSTRQTMHGCTADGGDGSASGLFGYVANELRAATGQAPTDLFVPGGCITISDIGAPPSFLPVQTNVAQSQDNVSWRGGVNFKTPDGDLYYVLASRGFKAGVFPFQDTILASQAQPVRQEELTAYEAGFKLALAAHRVQLNGAVFYYDYLDKQFFTYQPSPLGPSATIVNIPKSHVIGQDLEITALPALGLTLHAAVTHISTRVGNFQGYDIQLAVVDFTGKSFNFAPDWSATAGAEYTWPTGAGPALFVGADAVLESTTYADLGENPATEIPARTVFDARLGLQTGRWRVGLWGRNLGNKYYWNTVAPGGPDTNVKFAGAPRTFGLSGSYRF